MDSDQLFQDAVAASQAEFERIQSGRSAVDALVLSLNLGLELIQMAPDLETAKDIAQTLRDALKEGWG